MSPSCLHLDSPEVDLEADIWVYMLTEAHPKRQNVRKTIGRWHHDKQDYVLPWTLLSTGSLWSPTA